VVGLLGRDFEKLQQVINAAVLGSIYSLFAFGIGLPWGTMNVLNLAHGSIFLLCGFICYVLSVKARVPLNLPEAAAVAIAVGVCADWLIELIVFRQIRRRSSNDGEAQLLMVIGSVGIAGIPIAIANNVTGGVPFMILQQPTHSREHELFGASISNLEISIIALSVGIVVAAALWVRFSRHGRGLRAIAVDPEIASLMGISRSRASAIVMGISGGTAGLAGVLFGEYLASLQSTSGEDLLLKGFAVVVVGGVGSLWGLLVGAFALAVGEVVVTATTSGVWTDGVSFALIIVILLLRPNGIFGRATVDRT
jgi:branched-chain amino acid transport system permease protein